MMKKSLTSLMTLALISATSCYANSNSAAVAGGTHGDDQVEQIGKALAAAAQAKRDPESLIPNKVHVSFNHGNNPPISTDLFLSIDGANFIALKTTPYVTAYDRVTGAKTVENIESGLTFSISPIYNQNKSDFSYNVTYKYKATPSVKNFDVDGVAVSTIEGQAIVGSDMSLKLVKDVEQCSASSTPVDTSFCVKAY
ncbi:hypothetical protein [Vibrio sp. Hal054]|uniref:hypothetical protein n=1 Tax=Vibrio sp. Hal054 TaxID=3035158 RepID=UPI00301DAF6A